MKSGWDGVGKRGEDVDQPADVKKAKKGLERAIHYKRCPHVRERRWAMTVANPVDGNSGGARENHRHNDRMIIQYEINMKDFDFLSLPWWMDLELDILPAS